MADIKTRDVVKGTIKKIDKAAIAADRMRSAYVQAKEKAEHTTHPDEHNAEEYASDRVEGGVDRITHEAAHQFDKQGRKGLVLTCKERLIHYYAKFGFVDEGVSEKSTHGNVVWHQMRLTF